MTHMKPGPKRKDFYFYVDKSGDCWNWIGTKNQWGYGRFTRNYKQVFAHREAYEMEFGKLEPGSVVLHKCDNPGCVRPDHLFLGSHSSNQADKVSKNRQAKGSKIGSSVLKEGQVIEIRKKYSFRKVAYKDLAVEYGVCKDTIQKAVRGINWGHLV